MKQIEVQIMGQSYMLTAPDNGEATMLAAAARVDQAMCRIRDVGKSKARDRIAVLVALNFAFEMAQVAQQPKAQAVADTPAPEALALPSSEKAEQILARLNQALEQDGQLI